MSRGTVILGFNVNKGNSVSYNSVTYNLSTSGPSVWYYTSTTLVTSLILNGFPAPEPSL